MKPGVRALFNALPPSDWMQRVLHPERYTRDGYAIDDHTQDLSGLPMVWVREGDRMVGYVSDGCIMSYPLYDIAGQLWFDGVQKRRRQRTQFTEVSKNVLLAEELPVDRNDFGPFQLGHYPREGTFTGSETPEKP